MCFLEGVYIVSPVPKKYKLANNYKKGHKKDAKPGKGD